MAVSFAEKTAMLLGDLTITGGLLLTIPVLLLAITTFILSEQQRAIAQKAKRQLRYVQMKENELSSETYDIVALKTLSDKATAILKKEASREIPTTLISILMATFILLSSLGVYSLLSTYYTAYQHGYRDGFNNNAYSLWRGIHDSPKEDKLPDDLKGTLIVIYRFGCQDCETTYDELSEQLQGISNTYWIASRSDQGQDFLKEYPLDSVPSAVYIKQDGSYLSYQLYETSTDGAVLHQQNLEDMLRAVAYDREQPIH